MFTDPPYYDSVPYAHLSDLFYVWLRRAPAAADTGMFRGDATPKKEECVVDRPHKANPGAKTASDYAAKLASALAVGRQVASQTAIGTVVFAHKTTEGWEALLSAMIGGGWVSTASWPVATEMPAKVGAAGKALLLSSVHLICRPRPNHAGVGDWGEVHAEMQQRVKEWMVRLREERIRGADAIFSCIGPALESYSRYERVETAAGKIVPLGGDPDADEPHKRGFLSYVFEAVSREALENVLGKAETEGFEEDARLTALFLWTLQTTKTNGLNGKSAAVESDEDAGGDEAEDEEKPARATAGLAMPFDTFIRITRPMGIHYPDWEKRIIEIEKGVVHLRPVAERSEELLGVPAGGDVREFTLPKPQLKLFGKEEVQRQVVAAKRGVAGRIEEQTTLDRLHVAMLLFRAGQTTLLRQLLDDERKRGRRFERLALALTALYPEKSEERRWLEGVQAVMGR